MRFLLLVAVLASALFAQQAAPPPLTAADFSGADAGLFTDRTFLRLKPGIGAASVEAMENPVLRHAARELRAGRFRPGDRLRICRPFEPVESLSRRFKTSGYSQFENPTGIWFEAGEDAVLSVGPTKDQKIEMRVCNFGRQGGDKTYALQEGVNVIRMADAGLAYLRYHPDSWETASPIGASILTGKVNGVFDPVTQTNEDWKRMLAGAVCEMVDIYGPQVHLVFPVAEMRQWCPEKGRELSALYERIIRREHEMMGLVKYGLVPRNHMFGRAIWQGYMHADGIGAAFHHDTLRDIGNPERIPTNSWGIAHEFGHVNQVRPGMRWVSTTEVTNNLFSMWVNFDLNPRSMRLEHERTDGGDGNVVGGRFNAFLNSALVAGDCWLCQKGPDKMEGYENGGDHFVKLVPLWQLQLYYGAAGLGNKDFYPDIFQKVRLTDESGMSNGRLQLNFMRNACDSARQDLSEFFIRTGMLKPIDRELDDYRRGQLTITRQDCDDLIEYAARYPKPESPVIFYISANSLEAYKNRLSVRGSVRQGVTVKGRTRIIDHAAWKNVAAFETWRGNELVKVAMAGTGSEANASTLVQYPEGSTRIEAVAWDGKRTLVEGIR